MKSLTKLLLAITLMSIRTSKKALTIDITHEEPTHELNQTYLNSDHDNSYRIKLDDMDLMDNNKMFIIVESENPETVLSILDGESDLKNSSSKIDISTHSGNIMFVMDDKYYNGHLNYFKENKELKFKINMGTISQYSPDYKIKVQFQIQGDLTAGKTYQTRIDKNIEEVQVLYSYSKPEDIYKLRFQVQVLKSDRDFNLNATVSDPQGSHYILNEVFKQTVGGLINKEKFTVCEKEACDYTMYIRQKGVKSMIIECQVGKEIEELTYMHYGPYYEKKYSKKSVTTYYLPYHPEIDGLDISITLTPVIGNSGLYINAQNKPNNLSDYLWKEEGKLAKRITIKSEELKQMQIDKVNLYISVYNEDPGEFLLNVVGHESGLRGVLQHGVIEAGFVKAKEINNYLYLFEVYKDEQFDFDIHMNVITGNSNLYMKQCESLGDCSFSEGNLQDQNVFSVVNTHEKKQLKHSFTCQHQQGYPSTVCYIVVGVVGEEDHGTHFDLVLHENEKHRLITPGHLLKLSLNPQQTTYLKFSYPHKSTSESQLILSIDPIWGNFSVHISKDNEQPDAKNSLLSKSFKSTLSGLYNAFQNINLSEEIKNQRIEGTYYIAVESLTSCQVNIKFYELSDQSVVLHTLSAGEQQRGLIHKNQEIVYYSIKASLTNEQASTVTINLTPIKGKFEIFTARDGQFPTRETHDLTSKNNILELTYDEYKNKEEYIIGVAPLKSTGEEEKEDLQFLIAFNYSNKPLKLKPGVISTFFMKKQNYFIIDITAEMSDLLVLKAFQDEKMQMCAFFNGLENFSGVKDQCQYSENYGTSFYFKNDELKKNCQKFQQNSCYLILKMIGDKERKFSLGYTYNDKPFKIVKETIINGPNITKGNARLNFIEHLDKNDSSVISFNSKGLDLNIYTKLVSGENFKDDIFLPFPTANDHDEDARQQLGEVTNIFYGQDTIQKIGENPELLISVRPNPNADISDLIFDGKMNFQMHSGEDTISLPVNKPTSLSLDMEEYYYFSFYNHGQIGILTITITSDSNALIEIYVAKNLGSRPPFQDNYLKKASGIGQIHLLLDEKDFKGTKEEISSVMKGYFTIGVKANQSTSINIFWNNSLSTDVHELTPGFPQTIYCTDYRDQYFKFIARDKEQPSKPEDRGIIRIYINSQIRTNIYLQVSKENSGLIAERINKDYDWKSSIGSEGGVHMLEISPSDPNYCINCTYYGYLETIQEGRVEVSVNIEHIDFPIMLMSGISYPELLKKGEKKIYQYYNSDSDQFSMSLSLLSGQIEVFLSTDAKVSATNYVEKFEINNEHKYFYSIVKPSKYKVSSGSHFYIFIQNIDAAKSSFNMTVMKNQLKQPIEFGIIKPIGLGQMESADFFFQNTKNIKNYRVELEIVQIEEFNLYAQAKFHLENTLEVFYNDKDNGKVKIPHKILSHHLNKINIIFEIGNPKERNFFTIQIYNPINSFVKYNLLLIQDKYRMLNLDENNVEEVNKNRPRIFEIISNQGENLFFDVRSCFGQFEVSFVEADYDRISNKQFVDKKTIKDENSMVHYIKPQSNRVFVQIEVPKKSEFDKAILNIKAFNERHLDVNPYSEVSHINDGKIQFDTESMEVVFDPIIIKSTYKSEFKHHINYHVYLSHQIKAMRFLKNCKQHFYQQHFPDVDFFEFKHLEKYNSIEELNSKQNKKIKIKVEGIQPQKKYYGVIIASIILYSPDETYVKPIKEGTAYYDEFIVVSPRYNFPFVYIVSISLVLGVLLAIYYLIDGYIFGKINQYNQLTKLKDLRNLENNVNGFKTVDILEEEYYNLKKDKQAEVTLEENNDDQNTENQGSNSNFKEEEDSEREIELSDRNVPLEMDL